MAPNGFNDKNNEPSHDENGKPLRVFESMTIYKQYYEYNAIKETMYSQIKNVNRFANVHMVCGVIYLLFLILSCFLGAEVI